MSFVKLSTALYILYIEAQILYLDSARTPLDSPKFDFLSKAGLSQ